MNKKKNPNIVFLVLDAASALHFSCYGYKKKTSPNIDKIAKNSTLYKNSITNSLWTLPAHASLVTGEYPHEHKCVDWKCEIDNVLVRELKKKGYKTYGLPAIGHGFEKEFDYYSLDTFAGRERIFDDRNLYDLLIPIERDYKFVSQRKKYIKMIKCLIENYETKPFINGMYKFYVRKILDEVFLKWKDFGTEKRINQMISVLKNSKNSTFIFSNLVETHYPYKPARHLEKFLPKGVKRKDLRRVLKNSFLEATLYKNKRLNEKDRKILEALYNAEIRYVDEMIGKLYKFLEKSGKLSNTVLIITADHGDSLGEKGVYGHRAEMLDSILRTPLIIKTPTNKKKVVNGYVEFKDLYKHVLDLSEGNWNHIEAKDYAISEYYGLDTQHVNVFKRGIDKTFWGRFQIAFFKDGKKLIWDSLNVKKGYKEFVKDIKRYISSPKDEFEKYRKQ